MLNNFLRYMKEHDLPLDFYSWHTYTADIGDIRANAAIARGMLDQYGFTKTESILDEWNYMMNMPDIWGRIFNGSNARARSVVFSEASGVTGAAFTAAALVAMTDLPIDIATFYDGQPTNLFGTIFDRYGQPTKQFYAFDAFNRLKACGERAELGCGAPGIYALAAVSEQTAAILAVNWESRTDSYAFEIKGLDLDSSYRYELYVLDDTMDLAKVREMTGKLPELPQKVYLHNNSLTLIRMSKI